MIQKHESQLTIFDKWGALNRRNKALTDALTGLLASDPGIAQITDDQLRAVACDGDAEPSKRRQAEAILKVRQALAVVKQ